MKFQKLFFLAALFSIAGSLSLHAQTVIGRQKVDQYPTQSWGKLTYGLTWIPEDYNTTTGNYPLIIFLHGMGECGDGISGLNKLLYYGVPQKIANGWNPNATNPADGKNSKFIVVSPQAPAASKWSYGYGHLQWILADVVKRYRVDVSRIYVTGISAGGAGTWSVVTNGATFAKKISAVVPVSAAGTNTASEKSQIPYVGGTYGAKVWNICGTLDSWHAFAQTATKDINNASPAPQVTAKLTGIAGQGHSSSVWHTTYDPNWRNNEQKMNIYEWMLQYARTGTESTTPNTLPTANAGSDKSITLPTNSLQLAGTATDADGTIATYAWSKVSGGAATFSSTTVANPSISGLAEGTYTFRLTATDNSGGSSSDEVVVTVQSSSTSTSTTSPGSSTTPVRIQAESWSSMNGVKTETTRDADGVLNVGWQENGDWMDYSVNVPSAGTYTINLRVATVNTGVQAQLRNASGAILSTISVNNTGGWQTYQTIATQVTLPAGPQTLRMFTKDAKSTGWNFNWFELTPAATSTVAARTATAEEATTTGTTGIYPNPVQDRFVLQVSNEYTGAMTAAVYDLGGALVKTFRLQKGTKGASQSYLSAAGLKAGEYFIKVNMAGWSQTVKMNKQ